MAREIIFNVRFICSVILFLIRNYYAIFFIMQIFSVFLSLSRQIYQSESVIGSISIDTIVGFAIFLCFSSALLICIAATMNAEFRSQYLLAVRSGELDKLLLTIFPRK